MNSMLNGLPALQESTENEFPHDTLKRVFRLGWRYISQIPYTEICNNGVDIALSYR